MALSIACSSKESPSAASPTPASRTAASPVPACPNPQGGSCLGPLAAGTYTTSSFQPALTYEVPSGWGNFEDLSGNFLLIPPGGDLAGVDPGTSDYVGVYTSVVACEGNQPNVGGTPEDIAGWITDQPDLRSTDPRQVSIGGLDGEVLDVKLATGSDGACLISGVAPSSFAHGVIPGLTIRLYLLQGAGTLAIEVDDVQGGGNNLNAYSAVVKDFHFQA